MSCLRQKAFRCDELVEEVENLQQKLTEVSQDANDKSKSERELLSQLMSLKHDNNELASAVKKLELAEDAVKVVPPPVNLLSYWLFEVHVMLMFENILFTKSTQKLKLSVRLKKRFSSMLCTISLLEGFFRLSKLESTKIPSRMAKLHWSLSPVKFRYHVEVWVITLVNPSFLLYYWATPSLLLVIM